MADQRVWVVLANGRGGRQKIHGGKAYTDELDALRVAGSSPLLVVEPLTLIPSSLSTTGAATGSGTAG
jgi:hypothetical protein